MSRPTTTTAALLPALSAALGLPSGLRRLDHGASGRGDADISCAGGPSSDGGDRGERGDGSPPGRVPPDLAARARDNASRIYARRVVDRAKEEGEHPWNSAGRRRRKEGRRRREADNGGAGPPSPSAIRSARDRILSEALVGLADLQYGPGIGSPGGDFGVGRGLPRGILPPSVASCEGTRDLYGRLSASIDSGPSAASDSVVDDAEKPAEWGEGIDLAERRLVFGREISPLTSTTSAQRVGMAARRIATLGLLAAPLGVMVPLNVVLGKAAGKPAPRNEGGEDGTGRKPTLLQRWHRSVTRSTWDYALWAVETAGPTYIKLVQWASTRNDLFSPEFVGHFAKLQDETRGHSWRETERALVRAYGRDWRDVLSFDAVIDDGLDDDDDAAGDGGGGGGSLMRKKGGAANRSRQARLGRRETRVPSSSPPTVPIGSGCVAQVYKARLRRSHGLHPAGTSVAVKVQHPNILEKVCLDFYIVNKLAALLERVPYLNLDYLSVKDSVDQFRDIMLPQLDLRVEAHNLRRFRRDFQGETQIAFPEPMMGLTSREVLVERFVEGEPMLNFVRREDGEHSREDREELARIGLETVMKMIFLHDFIHADLHPGNMIVDRNRSVRGSPIRITMIDCGLTVELGERDHMNLVKILGSLIKRDGYAAGALMVDAAKKCQGSELDVELFCRGIEKICIDDEDNNFLESVGDYISDICYLACRHRVKLEAAFINAALACEIMEGLAASLYPSMEVQSVALPMVLKAEMMHGLKNLPSPRLGGLW